MAPRTASSTNKRKTVSCDVDKRRAAKRRALVVAVQDGEVVPKHVRDLLVSCIPGCFPIVHKYQQRMIGQVSAVLQQIDTSFVRKVEKAEEEAQRFHAQASTLPEEQKTASNGLTTASARLTAAKEALSTATAEKLTASTKLKAAEDRMRRVDTEIAKKSMERYQLEEGCGSHLLAAGQAGSQSNIDAAIQFRAQEIRRLAAERIRLCDAESEGLTMCSLADAKISGQQLLVDNAESTRYAFALQLKDVYDKLRQLPAEQQRCRELVAESKARLEAFRAGPVATLKAEMDEAAASVPQAERKPSRENRRASFADIRRRRHSFLSRKAVEAICAKADVPTLAVRSATKQKLDGQPGSSPQVTAIPTPARRVSAGQK